ncbi:MULTISPECIES: hypothetical protein [Pedobacter]|uniref:hypothetical protein n=1 Tax=Pedobacter TaxID=84567 RepID=UPI00292CBF37|nr:MULTISPECIES: hypothetical protein [Pedobacter]
MKTITKFAFIAMIAALGFYNIQIDKSAHFGINLSLVENSASANFEDTSGPRKVAVKNEETGSTVTSMIVDGKVCKNSSDFVTVNCIGTGSVSCTPSHTISNQKIVCS